MKPEHLIDGFNIVSILFSILLFFGLLQTESEIFQKISFVVKIILGCLLIYKFNDYYPSNQFTLVDRKLCFLAGWYIIAFTLGDYISSFSTKATETIMNVLHLKF